MDRNILASRHKQIEAYIHRTPILSSTLINKIAGCQIYFKCENFQKMGAFKMRGAVSAILQLTDEQKANGVVTHSSGNFAQALSLAAKSIGIPAYIVMPENAPQVKKDAVRDYGGIIIECESTAIARETKAQEIVNEKNTSFIHPSNDLDVILGQATAALELIEDKPDLDYILSPVGGGGLLAGTALSTHFFAKECKVIGCEPANMDDAYRSFKSGKLITENHDYTIADGLRTFLGDVNFPIILKYVDDIIRVPEEEIVPAMKLIWERMKIVVEPSSAVALAGLMSQLDVKPAEKVGIILSGGNVDLSKLPF